MIAIKAGRDPLLLAAQVLLWFFIGVLGFALFFVAPGAPAAAIFQDQLLTEVAEKGVTAGPELIGAVVALLGGLSIFLALAIYFLFLLLRIVGSMKESHPFIANNARRLSRMACIALAGQLVMIPAAAIAIWIEQIAGDVTGIKSDGDFGISGEGLLLVLILFILAWVFRIGAEMRAEREGTV